MAIEALCPNGHKILCPEDRAGRTARCPKCSAPFRIPEPKGNGPLPSGRSAQPAVSASDDYDFAATAAVLASGSSPSHVGVPPSEPGSDATSPDAAAANSPPGEGTKPHAKPPSLQDLIIFLCPNGHKLNGPRRLAGKVGKCPHCGVKFEIPFPDEDEGDPDGLDDTVTEDPLRDYSVEGGSSAADEHFREQQPEDSDAPLELESLFDAVRANPDSDVIGRVVGRSSKAKHPAAPAAPPQASAQHPPDALHNEEHPLAQLVARLWAEREHGGIIELHLNGGVMLVPEWFDQHHSQKSHGLFASQAADGTVTMTIVPWDEVTRVVVRGVVGLPDGMFE
jgi:hypothetical protein